MPGWRNWQTRRTQNPVLAREWEFDPPSGHHELIVYQRGCVDSMPIPADRIVCEHQSNKTRISSVDMFEMVAYSSGSRVMKKLNILNVGPIFVSLITVISIYMLNLTEEAAHA